MTDAAFIDMMTSPEYARANRERVNGCAALTFVAARATSRKLLRRAVASG